MLYIIINTFVLPWLLYNFFAQINSFSFHQFIVISNIRTKITEILLNKNELSEELHNFLKTKFDLMYKLWKNMLNLSTIKIRSILNLFFPYNQMNQKVFFFDPDKNVQSSNENGLPGTKEIQRIIYKHQFPSQCNDREFIVLTQFENSQSGIGSLINFISSFISFGIDSNKTTIYYPNSYSFLVRGGKCQEAGFDCFFQSISNCSFTKKEIDSNPKKFQKQSITDFSKLKNYPV